MAEMEMLGGLMDEGGTVDPVSGNEVPSGSTQEEVRDDIPAQLSEGEFVFPADVVRYIGLENLMKMRSMAKAGLAKMEAMGQMGNSEEAIISDTMPFDDPIDQFIDEMDQDDPVMFQVGGLAGQPTQQQPTGNFLPPGVTRPTVSATTPPPKISPSEGGIPVYETRQFIGPDGTIRTFTFLDGKLIQNIPEGFNPYVEPEAQPEVEQPVVQQPADSAGGDGRDDREREAERQAQMARDRKTNSILASLDPDFAKIAAEDPFMTGDFVSPLVGVAATVRTMRARTPSIEKLADQYGLNIDDYKNSFPASLFSKYDDDKFADDAAEKQIDLDVSDAGGEAIPTTSVARSTQTIEDTRRRRAEEEQEQARKEQEIIDQNFAESLQRSQQLRGQANIAPEDFDVSAPKQEAVKPVEQPIETKQDDTGVPDAQRLQAQRLDPLGVAPNLGEAQRQQLGINFDEESAADETPLSPFTDRLKEGVRVEKPLPTPQFRSYAADDSGRAFQKSALGRATALTTPAQRAQLEQNAKEQEEARVYDESYDSSDREGGDSAQDVGGGTVGGQGGGLSGPFKKGGLASLKTKTKPKKKMKRGGLASKK